MDHPATKAASLTQTFTEYVEQLIISGDFAAGERLPPERELAVRTGVSRPVVHESLVKMESKGLVRIVPRHGAYVNDYHTRGSLDLLLSMMRYGSSSSEQGLADDLCDLRDLLEPEIASLAALGATLDDLSELEDILRRERLTSSSHTQELAQITFRFHQRLARASGNRLYPMLLNSLKELYLRLCVNCCAVPASREHQQLHQRRIVDAIMAQDGVRAAESMRALLRLYRSSMKQEAAE
jgi:GntR family transcriptional regulator, transcriptional repressor for pyruvate dehydrogenase complex